MEGKLGGQALVLDVEGTWRELTAVVNKLAANLTNQVCFIQTLITYVVFCSSILGVGDGSVLATAVPCGLRVIARWL